MSEFPLTNYDPVTKKYTGAFGVWFIPDDVLKLAVRLWSRFGRDYLHDWTKRQYILNERDE